MQFSRRVTIARDTDLVNVCGQTGMSSEGRQVAAANIPSPCRTSYGIYLDPSGWPGSSKMGVDRDTFFDRFQWGCDLWNDALDLKLYLSTNIKSAKCYATFAHLGGSTLAWSSLANNSCADDKQQRYDIRRWDPHTLGLTAGHEHGHLIGLHHNNGDFLMNPVILSGLDGLTANDIRRAVALGYERQVSPPQPPEPPSPPNEPDPPSDETEIDRLRSRLDEFIGHSKRVAFYLEHAVRALASRRGWRRVSSDEIDNLYRELRKLRNLK